MNKSAEEIIVQLGDLVKTMWNQHENPEGLRKTLNDISVLNWALAMWQTEVEEAELNMKAELDLDAANLMLGFTEKGDAVNKSEIRTTIALGPKRKEYNQMKSNVNKIKTMGRAAQGAMDSLRTQLATIREGIKNG